MPSRSIRERRDRERRRVFVGRETELSALRSLLAGDEPSHNICEITGLGGIGKSALLQHFLKQVPARVASAEATIEISQTPLAILTAWAHSLDQPDALEEFWKRQSRYSKALERVATEDAGLASGVVQVAENAGVAGAFVSGALGRERMRSLLGKILPGPDVELYLDAPEHLTEAFLQGINDLADETGRVLLALDYYEGATTEVDRWLRSLLDRDLSIQVVLIVVGREPLIKTDRRWLEWRTAILPIRLGPLSSDETRQYLDRRGVSDRDDVQELVRSSHGIPAAIEWSADFVLSGTGASLGPAGPTSIAEVHQVVTDRMISQMEGGDRRFLDALFACSSVRWFSEELLSELLESSADEELDYLLHYSFVTVRPDATFALDDTFRFYIDRRLRGRRMAQWIKYHQIAAGYHSRHREALTPLSSTWLVHLIEETYHAFCIDPQEGSSALALDLLQLPWPALVQHINPVVEAARAATNGGASAVLSFAEGLLSLAAGEFEVAVESLGMALDRAVDPSADARLRFSAAIHLVDALVRQASMAEALQVAADWAERASISNEPVLSALLYARAAEASNSLGDTETSREFSARAEGTLFVAEPDLQSGEAWMILAWTYAFRGEYSAARRSVEHARAAWILAEHDYGIAQLNSTASWLSFLNGDCEVAIGQARAAIDYFTGAEDHYFAAMARMNLAEALRRQGDLDDAIDAGEESARTMSELGASIYQGIATYRLGRALFDRGDLQEAKSRLLIAFDIEASLVDEKYSLGMTSMYLFDVEIELDNIADAIEFGTVAADAWSQAGHLHGRAFGGLVRAKLGLLNLDFDRARSDLNESLQLARAHHYLDVEAESVLLATVVEVVSGTIELAEAAVEAVDSAARMADAFSPTLRQDCHRRTLGLLSASRLQERPDVAELLAVWRGNSAD